MKDKILQASLKLFTQKGYADTTISDILKELDISKGGLYHHFASKEEILTSIAEQFADQIVEQIQTSVTDTATTQQKIQAIITAKNGIDPNLQNVLLSVIQYRDPYIVDVLVNALRVKLVPMIEELFFSGVEDEAEKAAKAHVLFGLTQMGYYLPGEVMQDAHIATEVVKLQLELVEKINQQHKSTNKN